MNIKKNGQRCVWADHPRRVTSSPGYITTPDKIGLDYGPNPLERVLLTSPAMNSPGGGGCQE